MKSIEMFIGKNDLEDVKPLLDYAKERNIIKDWTWHFTSADEKGDYEIEITLFQHPMKVEK